MDDYEAKLQNLEARADSIERMEIADRDSREAGRGSAGVPFLSGDHKIVRWAVARLRKGEGRMKSYDIRLIKQVGHQIGDRRWIHRWITLPFVPFLNLEIVVDPKGHQIKVLSVAWFDAEGTFCCNTRLDSIAGASVSEYLAEGWTLGRGGARP